MVHIVQKGNKFYRYKSVRVGNQVRSVYLGAVDPAVMKGQVAGAKRDKRKLHVIVKDMKTRSKHVTTDVNKWSGSKGKRDLVGWDTKHIITTLKKHRTVLNRERRQIRDDLDLKRVDGRVKTTKSTVGKLVQRSRTRDTHLGDIHDLAGLRVTVKSIKDIRSTSKRLEKKYDIIEKEDYVTKHNHGYRSVHYLVRTKDRMVYELQLRTPRQTRWADYAHETMYKNKKESMRVLGPKEHKNVSTWLLKLSHHYHDLDRGKKSTAPRQPESSKRLVTLLPDYAKKDLVGPKPRWRVNTE